MTEAEGNEEICDLVKRSLIDEASLILQSHNRRTIEEGKRF